MLNLRLSSIIGYYDAIDSTDIKMDELGKTIQTEDIPLRITHKDNGTSSIHYQRHKKQEMVTSKIFSSLFKKFEKNKIFVQYISYSFWNLKKDERNKLDVMEMRCLRSMLGIC